MTIAMQSLPGARHAATPVSMKWAALSDAANAVAVLAGENQGKPGAELRSFPAVLRDVEPWRRELAESGVDDLTFVMQCGLSALLAIKARGADPRPAAQALWREFSASRGAILSLLPRNGAMGPRRSA